MENPPNFSNNPITPPHKSVSHWLIVVVAIITVLGYFITSYAFSLWPFGDLVPPLATPVACTQEAKLCPDGTAVGRTGPNCEFAKCPEATETSTWKTYRNEEYGFEISYPDKDWRVEESGIGDGPILAGFYFGPIVPPIINTDTTTVRDMSNWGVQVWDKSRATVNQINARPGSIQYEKDGKIYVIFNEGSRLEPQLFETFYLSFGFINIEVMGTLSGKVSIGPNCPVEREGVMCTPSPEAYASREFIVLDSNQKEVTRFHADANGNYSVMLPMGTYTVVSANTGMGYMSKDLPSTVTIKAGQTITLNIDIDTGIR